MKLEFESNTSTLPLAGKDFDNGAAEHDTAKISEMLQAGIKAAQNGDRDEARQLLLQVTEAEPQNESAWLWMASISEYPEELLIFLNNVLNINPNNARALEWTKATKSLLAQTFVERGIDASNDANKELAKQYFWQAIAHDDKNETAWLSLASVSDSTDGKIVHLQKVLNINPENEEAKAALQAAKNQAVESLLRKANSAAVAGEREQAKEMLQEVLKSAPELEEAWILKSYLADSFSEKITCFEKVLTFNPENEMAISGLASLREMMAKAESKKIEQAAMLAKAVENASAKEAAAKAEEQFFFQVAEENQPTQKLEFPPDFAPAEHFNDTQQNHGDIYQGQEVPSQPMFDEHSNENKFLAENNFMTYDTTDNSALTPDEAGKTDYPPKFEDAEPSLFEKDYSENMNGFSAPSEGNFIGGNSSKSSVEMSACPFCNAANEANAFVCSSCKTILTLSDVEMLLANSEADREVLRQAVERMESEKSVREFSAEELKNLAIGHINLKNLRQGVAYLQKAAQMTPNDVMLYSQVNSLKIRLSEIEQQESLQSTMSKNRKILIVDDSATVRKLISSKLEKSGHKVVSAVDGIDALEKIKEFVPDLILLDIMMPQLDGYQVCKLIRTNESTKDVPIVMISGKDGFFDKVRGRMAGATGYITKPFGPETLMKAVETYIVHKEEMLDENEEI